MAATTASANVYECGFCHNTSDGVDHNEATSIPDGQDPNDGWYVNIVFDVFNTPSPVYTAGTTDLSGTGVTATFVDLGCMPLADPS